MMLSAQDDFTGLVVGTSAFIHLHGGATTLYQYGRCFNQIW